MNSGIFIELPYETIFTICAEVSCIVLVIIDSPDLDVATLVFCKGIVTSPTIIHLKIILIE